MASTLSEAGFHTNPTQNMKNMNAEWKRLEAWIHFLTYLDFMSVERPYVGIVNGIIANAETNIPINGAIATLDGNSYITDTFASLFNKYTSNPDLLQNGFYYFEDVADGSYDVDVSAPGYYPQSKPAKSPGRADPSLASSSIRSCKRSRRSSRFRSKAERILVTASWQPKTR